MAISTVPAAGVAAVPASFGVWAGVSGGRSEDENGGVCGVDDKRWMWLLGGGWNIDKNEIISLYRCARSVTFQSFNFYELQISEKQLKIKSEAR